MKLVLFDEYKPGLLRGDEVVDVSGLVDGTGQEAMVHIITNFASLRPRLEQALASAAGTPRAQVRLRAPLPTPRKLVNAAGNYMEFIPGKERRPINMFLKNPDAVIGDGDTVNLPPVETTIVHHEAELGVVIGATATQVSAQNAMDHVFGYTCMCDVSPRGIGGGFIHKSPDTCAPMGPCIVTRDEVPDIQNVHVQLWVDGEIRQDYGTDDMEWPITALIEWASGFITLNPGDVMSCGTNHQGIGPIQDGERVEMEIEHVGRFSFNVSDPLKRTWPKGVDRTMAERVREGRLALPSA